MKLLDIICVFFGSVGIAFGVRCYHELYKWARQCQGLRVAVAFKGRVQMQYPVLEWLLWGNLLDKDKDSTGRVIYKQGGTSIAIIKKPVTVKWWQRWRKPANLREGAWRAKDQSNAPGTA